MDAEKLVSMAKLDSNMQIDTSEDEMEQIASAPILSSLNSQKDNDRASPEE